MEMIKKLLYCVMLDDNNTRSLRSYLEDHSCSIEECQDILLKQFPHLIPNKTIDDIKVVHLLSECGDRIYKIRECVQNIHIDAYDLLPNDQITLATIIKQTSPLKNVFIREVVFDKLLVQHLMDCPRHAERYEVYRLTISEDKDMPASAYKNVAPLLNAANCTEMVFVRCNLTGDKLHQFGRGCSENSVTLTELKVFDKSMPADAFREFSTALDVTQCKKVVFGNCQLTSHKLSEFGSGCSHHGLSLKEFIVLDNWMPADVFREVATTLQVTRCKKIDFTFCGLTSRKLSEFSSGCSENGLSLEWIIINDKKMVEDVYKELSKLTGITECPWLRLQRCDLSKDKLLTFNNECQEQNIQLDKLDILNEAMPADVYHAVCNTFYVTKCQEISFIKCDITASKLQSFLTQSQKHRLTIAKLQIIEFKPDSVPTNEMVSVLCDLMSDVVEVLVICGWELNAGQLELMENTRRLTSSKAKVVTVMNKTSTSRDKNPYPTVWKNGEVVEVPREWIVAFYGFYKDENPYNENLMSSFDSFLMSA